MNCDDAFDLLTDLEWRHSVDLRRHLDQCSRCRDMAETLSPILGLWDDAVDSPVGQSPGISGFAAVHRADPASPAVMRTEAVEVAPSRVRKPKWAEARQWFAAFAAGLIVSLGFYAIDRRPTNAVVPLEPVTQCLWVDREAESSTRDQLPEAIILSCVACHVKTPAAHLKTLQQM